MLKNFLKFLLGFTILLCFYLIALVIIKFTHLNLPIGILGLILFTLSLSLGLIKEEWVEFTSEIFIKNMAILFVPFIVGLIAYKSILFKNGLSIILVVFITTLLTIVLTGLFVDYGIKIQRLKKMRRHND